MVIATSILPTDPGETDHPLMREGVPRELTFRHAALRSNFLQAWTGACLIAESVNHFVPQPDKGLARQLVGLAQGAAGALGVYHYGSKAADHPSAHNLMGTLTALGFLTEGSLRVKEAFKVHPQATAVAGLLTAAGKATNAGVLSTIPYVLDALCNMAEFAHGWKDPRQQANGPLPALHAFTQQWRTRDLAALQRGTGVAMMLIAAAKTALVATRPDTPDLRAQRFARDVTASWDALRLDHWISALDEAAAQSPEALAAVGADFVKALEKTEPSVPHQFAHVMRDAPAQAKRIIERHPDAARQAAQALLAARSPVLGALFAHHGIERPFGASAGG
jgi:hypothetical protein